jgi:hypothetical protein
MEARTMLNEDIGSYAEGQSRRHFRRGTMQGDYAAGQEKKPRVGTIQPVGDFAAGQEKRPTDPTALRGDFARGQREKPID